MITFQKNVSFVINQRFKKTNLWTNNCSFIQGEILLKVPSKPFLSINDKRNYFFFSGNSVQTFPLNWSVRTLWVLPTNEWPQIFPKICDSWKKYHLQNSKFLLTIFSKLWTFSESLWTLINKFIHKTLNAQWKQTWSVL